MQERACTCGLIVIEPDDLDEEGLCLLCAGTGHESGCACVACELYVLELELSGEPGLALEIAIRSAGSSAGSGSR